MIPFCLSFFFESFSTKILWPENGSVSVWYMVVDQVEGIVALQTAPWPPTS